MKTNMTQKGFTLIELLVVIVIIGILATISVATFSGYFAKARDTERVTFVTSARTAVQAESITQATTDFTFGAADAAATEAIVDAALDLQGIKAPDPVGSAPTIYYVVEGAFGAESQNFAVVACGEEADGTIFQAGTFQAAGACLSGVFTPAGTEEAVAIDLDA